MFTNKKGLPTFQPVAFFEKLATRAKNGLTSSNKNPNPVSPTATEIGDIRMTTTIGDRKCSFSACSEQIDLGDLIANYAEDTSGDDKVAPIIEYEIKPGAQVPEMYGFDEGTIFLSGYTNAERRLFGMCEIQLPGGEIQTHHFRDGALITPSEQMSPGTEIEMDDLGFITTVGRYNSYLFSRSAKIDSESLTPQRQKSESESDEEAPIMRYEINPGTQVPAMYGFPEGTTFAGGCTDIQRRLSGFCEIELPNKEKELHNFLRGQLIRKIPDFPEQINIKNLTLRFEEDSSGDSFIIGYEIKEGTEVHEFHGLPEGTIFVGGYTNKKRQPHGMCEIKLPGEKKEFRSFLNGELIEKRTQKK